MLSVCLFFSVTVSFKDDLILTLAIGSVDGTVVVYSCKDNDPHCLATLGRVEPHSPVKRCVLHRDQGLS